MANKKDISKPPTFKLKKGVKIQKDNVDKESAKNEPPKFVKPPKKDAPKFNTSSSALKASASATIPAPVIDKSKPKVSLIKRLQNQKKSMTAKQKKTMKKFIIIGGSIIAAIILFFITVAILNSTAFSAEKQVEAYMNSIKDGNLDEATRISPPVDIPDNAKQLLLGNAANQSGPLVDEANRIHDISITDVQVDGNTATMKVTYFIKDTSRTDEMSAHISSNSFLFFHNWRLSSTMVKHFEVKTNADGVQSFTANKIEFGVASATGSRTGTAYAYPGIYNVTADAKSKYIKGDSGEVIVPTSSEVSLKITPTDKLKQAINDAIKKEIDDCVKSANDNNGSIPTGCPWSSSYSGSYGYTSDTYKNYDWSVTKYPTVQNLNFESGSFTLNSGVMRLTYDYHEYDYDYCSYDYKHSFSSTDRDSCYRWIEKDNTSSVSATSGTYSIKLDEKKNENIQVELSKYGY
ncbi:MAG: hypothetical protein LBB10_02975 [Bifidobacteriaceae bacterium]|nr:hypothetical protein [Bifidobacteriaceae bacterium]